MNSQEQFVFAKNLSAGDLILFNNVWVEINSIEKNTNKGIFAPLTLSGTAMINGVLVSNYAYLPRHQEIHLAFFPLRALYKVFGGNVINYYINGVNWYANLLMRISEKLDNEFNYNYFMK